MEEATRCVTIIRELRTSNYSAAAAASECPLQFSKGPSTTITGKLEVQTPTSFDGHGKLGELNLHVTVDDVRCARSVVRHQLRLQHALVELQNFTVDLRWDFVRDVMRGSRVGSSSVRNAYQVLSVKIRQIFNEVNHMLIQFVGHVVEDSLLLLRFLTSLHF